VAAHRQSGKALFETEKNLNWKHDTEAIYNTFFDSLFTFSGKFSSRTIAKIFKKAVGHDVTNKEIELWADNFLKQLTLDEHKELREYLILQHMLTAEPSSQPWPASHDITIIREVPDEDEIPIKNGPDSEAEKERVDEPPNGGKGGSGRRKSNNHQLKKWIIAGATVLLVILVTVAIIFVEKFKSNSIEQAEQKAIAEQEAIEEQKAILAQKTIAVQKAIEDCSGCYMHVENLSDQIEQQADVQESDGSMMYQITVRVPDYTSFPAEALIENIDIPEYDINADTKALYIEKLQQNVKSSVLDFAQSCDTDYTKDETIAFDLTETGTSWETDVSESVQTALLDEQKVFTTELTDELYEDLDVCAEISIVAQRESIFQSIYRDDYLASEIQPVAIRITGENYYELDIRYPLPEYAADSSILSKRDDSEADATILVYYENETDPVPVADREGWEILLTEETAAKLAESYPAETDYSVYTDTLKEKYAGYAGQYLAADDEYGAFLCYVCSGDFAKACVLGEDLVETDYSIAALCYNGTVLSTGADTSDWTDIVSISSCDTNIVGRKKDGTAVCAGKLEGSWPYGWTTRIADVDIDLSGMTDIVSIGTNEKNVVGLRADGTVVGVGELRYDVTNGTDVNVYGWKNIVSVQSNDWNIIGLRSNGTVVADGTLYSGTKISLSDWTNISSVSANRHNIIGIRNDGTVICYGRVNGAKLDINNWTDVTMICANEYNVIGLRNDGTVLDAGAIDSGGWTLRIFDLSNWSGVKLIYASVYNVIGIREDGTVLGIGSVTLANGNYQTIDLSKWTDVVAINIANDGGWVVGLRGDGTVLSTGSEYDSETESWQTIDLSDWTDIVAIISNDSYIIGIRSDGTLVCNDESAASKIADWDLW